MLWDVTKKPPLVQVRVPGKYVGAIFSLKFDPNQERVFTASTCYVTSHNFSVGDKKNYLGERSRCKVGG